ncbi:pyridoxamine 5'-phosphate oxidase family protein [Gordonia sp. N1V]|uniref:pyridoxamine 5'-phosphate oxidase family protein n=1 Tax=Gordonia sp. N1V TaxID=3034163 RepID=UPI0023E310C6|nr:pyridoxamine 5'-phosphate oxidase family protein [Gordonia sp. N1V]MDF3283735.1 pyridoxamine 5'-phosphate oxidase family protein [Gordonia sp. N1V]
MTPTEFIAFIRSHPLGVVATVSPDGAPEAALVGIAVTDSAEIVFDTSRSSRKFANLAADSRVALVVGTTEEITVQCEGRADIPHGEAAQRCRDAYFAQYPDGRQRAADPDIVHVRVRPQWVRCADYRPDGGGVTERHW